ncbi:MAG: hypothetical protein ABW000_05095 [Actinoplanes sp.]
MTPDDVDSLLITARERAESGNRAQARRLLLHALSLDPESAEARAALVALAVPPGTDRPGAGWPGAGRDGIGRDGIGRDGVPPAPSGWIVLASAVSLIGVILLLLGVQRPAGYACVVFAAVILLLRGGIRGKRSESGA